MKISEVSEEIISVKRGKFPETISGALIEPQKSKAYRSIRLHPLSSLCNMLA